MRPDRAPLKISLHAPKPNPVTDVHRVDREDFDVSKEFAESVTDLELEQRARDDAAELEARYGLPPDVARRIVAMATSIDQAHAIAELMR